MHSGKQCRLLLRDKFVLDNVNLS
ncbi:hypothetical protein IFM89_009088 [Coptis chinensis]|uniref:Uncharacterized protein n=1 Tax=Coptis chinensis TaxID=261450 RepID=A0A835IL42_9MAGN|nr:hypothetical protein IFM89_009088 [Coptis chinensis]